MTEILKKIEQSVERLIRGMGLVLEAVRAPDYRPAAISFYGEKGGQLQFCVGGPRWRATEYRNDTDSGVRWADKVGAVFVEAAPPDPNNPGKLDWTNKKIVFALSDKDIGSILYAVRKGQEARILHANDDKTDTKRFQIGTANEFRGRQTFPVSLQHHKADGSESRVSVFLDGGDLMRLTILLEQAMPYILGANRV